MSDEQKKQYANEFVLFHHAVNQQKNDKNKVYSIHEPFTCYIAKGKPHKPYEFCNKVGLITTGKKGEKIITAILGFTDNIFDVHTTGPLLDQMRTNQLNLPQELVYDRGGKGKTEIDGVKILTPAKPTASDTAYQKLQKRRKFRARAVIEPIIRHLKTDFRKDQNYLLGEEGI